MAHRVLKSFLATYFWAQYKEKHIVALDSWIDHQRDWKQATDVSLRMSWGLLGLGGGVGGGVEGGRYRGEEKKGKI